MRRIAIHLILVAATTGFTGENRETTPERTAPGVANPTAFKGVYVDLSRCFDRNADTANQKAALENSIERIHASGFNVLMPYANTSSWSANYASEIVADRTVRTWEPLMVAAQAARRHGMQVWPAVCVMTCGGKEPRGVLQRNPDWAIRYPDGRPFGFFSPAHPEGRRWLQSAIVEIVQRCQPDGVLLDYLRLYNDDWRLDAQADAALQRQLDDEKLTEPAARRRRTRQIAADHLTSFARELCGTLRESKPDLKIAIYSWGPHVVENHPVCQDWRRWIAEGFIDGVNVSGYCYPSNYKSDYMRVFSDRLSKSVAYGRDAAKPIEFTFALGVHTSHGSIPDVASMTQYIHAAKAAGVTGVAVFTWNSFEPFADQARESALFAPFDMP